MSFVSPTEQNMNTSWLYQSTHGVVYQFRIFQIPKCQIVQAIPFSSSSQISKHPSKSFPPQLRTIFVLLFPNYFSLQNEHQVNHQISLRQTSRLKDSLCVFAC